MTGTMPAEICKNVGLTIELDECMKIKCGCCKQMTLASP
jgi:hypothetical protein